ncbi:hypothetical protein ACFQZ4_54380 [Catellatospora coxensis]|uniref:Uncharacterized protein n=1 Tax=Catellatospora coxensis TaxID=310354 RepID=A0A8J3L8I4_9ACTN|nr:hypothetical protein [Catellatospora coxensis]GIG11064.1 hypothetical protein Cco03nite_77640 [Catellatospora coxensis]
MSAQTEIALKVTADRPPVRVFGEPVAPGLSIVPSVYADGRYGVGFLLAHEPSGCVLTAVPTCVHCARQAGARLAGFDWTRPAPQLITDQAVREAVTCSDLVTLLRGCASAYTCEIPEGC